MPTTIGRGLGASLVPVMAMVALSADAPRGLLAGDRTQPDADAHGALNHQHSHAVVSFVASGHVVIFDAAARKPLQCFETTVSTTTKTRQAHAAFPALDGSYILVANQNG